MQPRDLVQCGLRAAKDSLPEVGLEQPGLATRVQRLEAQARMLEHLEDSYWWCVHPWLFIRRHEQMMNDTRDHRHQRPQRAWVLRLRV